MDPGADQGSALDLFEEYLKRQRLKMTDPRRTMVRVALAQTGHFTADDVHGRLREEGERVSLATVYRTLALLEESGLLEGHDFADGQRRYERALKREHHDHLICIDCRAVVEFQNRAIEELQEQVLVEHGFKMVHHALTMFASCETLRSTGRCPRKDSEGGRGAKRKRS
jgi:Fur family ferric uptake transcriptional regulator